MQSTIEVVRLAVEGFNREGVEGMLPYFTDDVEVYDPDLPAGDYRGIEAVRQVISELISGFARVAVEGVRVLTAGDRVVALLHSRGTGERDALEVEFRDAHMLTFRDGKISYWRVYLDRAEALSDAGLDPELAKVEPS